MQKAHEWIAHAETQLENLDKDIQERIKIVGTILKEDGGRPAPRSGKGAPPIGTRESVAKLARQGWSNDEIATALKLSKSEVELILEIGPKD